ncbi:MAG: tetratricopeptide repeat protein, partial [Nostoc sp.]|uniref:tetratricopeptide repeat protein n=1 Tax=Nostoc sp. TaxID=1180 RepID=UPI002FF53121
MSRNSEEDLNVIRAICVALGVPVFKYLFNLYSWNLLGFIILICAIIILVVFIREKISQSNILDDNPQSQESFPNNQDTNKSSSINASSQNIQWTEIGTYYSNTSQTNEKNYNADIEPDFLSGGNVNVTIEELLTNLIGQKDRVTGEVFSQGETVYFCVPCQLGYHEDSWQFLNQKCEQCGSDSITRYTLTTKYDEYINQGNACYNLGNNQAAIDNYNQAIRINPNFADIYNRRGAAHYTLGNNQAAIEDYNQAIRLNPNFAEAYNSRGVAHYKLGNNQAAIEDYNQAIRLNPNFAEAYNSRGVAHYKLGNNQAAI